MIFKEYCDVFELLFLVHRRQTALVPLVPHKRLIVIAQVGDRIVAVNAQLKSDKQQTDTTKQQLVHEAANLKTQLQAVQQREQMESQQREQVSCNLKLYTCCLLKFPSVS